MLYKPFAMQLYVSALPKMCASNQFNSANPQYDGVHHNGANNYHILRSEALAASTGNAVSKYANEAS